MDRIRTPVSSSPKVGFTSGTKTVRRAPAHSDVKFAWCSRDQALLSMITALLRKAFSASSVSYSPLQKTSKPAPVRHKVKNYVVQRYVATIFRIAGTNCTKPAAISTVLYRKQQTQTVPARNRLGRYKRRAEAPDLGHVSVEPCYERFSASTKTTSHAVGIPTATPGYQYSVTSRTVRAAPR
eukprot:888234-Rhodomonas_salina.2